MYYYYGLHCCPFVVQLDRCVGSCNTLNGFSKNICVLNKTEDLNISAFNTITSINESKTLTKYISSKCQCNIDDFNSN